MKFLAYYLVVTPVASAPTKPQVKDESDQLVINSTRRVAR